MRMRLSAAVASSLVALVATTVPADAASVGFTDPSGDAPRRFDLTRIDADNGSDTLTVRAKVRALRGGSPQIFALFLTEGPDRTNYTLHSVRRAHGVVRNRFWIGPDRAACDATARWRVARDRIIVRIPQSCFEDTGWLRVSAAIGAGDGTSGDPADWTRGVGVRHD